MVLPMLLAVTAGLLWLLVVGLGQMRTTDAAREAARFAAVEPCDQSGIAGKASAALDGAPVSGAAPTIDVDTPADVRVGDEITVHVHFTTPDLGFFPGFDGQVDKSATSRVENVPAGGC